MATSDDATRKDAPGAMSVTATMVGAPGAADPDEAQVEQVGRYRIERRLGRGGMGDVYRAYDPLLDRAVALKVLRQERDVGSRSRMRVIREARAAAALTHPNAVTVYDVGEANGDAFIAMELLEGEDLRSILRRADGTREQHLCWLLEAARALDAAHGRGLVHRDVKPENMFICNGGGLKLLDFGIAKRDGVDEPALGKGDDLGPSSLRTVEGARVGTPRYMAPEQQRGHATDARTDEYAWGLVALELLGGSTLAEVKSTAPVGERGRAPRSREDVRRHLDSIRPPLASGVKAAVVRALEPDKDARFPSMAPIVAAFESKNEEAPAAAAELGRDDVAPTLRDPEARTVPAESTLDLGSAPRAASSPIAPSAPAAPSRSRLGVVALVTAGVLGVGVAAMAIAKASSSIGRADLTPSTSTPPPGPVTACRVTSMRTFTVGANLRYTVLSDGGLVFARKVPRGIVIEREDAAPLDDSSLLERSGLDVDEVSIFGVSLGGAPVVGVHRRALIGASSISLVTKAGLVTQTFRGVLTGIAMAGGGEAVRVLVTRGVEVVEERAGQRDVIEHGAELVIVSRRGAGKGRMLEHASASAPAIAARADRVAVAYTTPAGVRFVSLDSDGGPLDEVRPVTAEQARPAIAFAGEVPAVAWVELAKRRVATSLMAAAPRSRTVVEEDVQDRVPVAFSSGASSVAIAWVSKAAHGYSVRLSSVTSEGIVGLPIDVGPPSVTEIDVLRAAPLDGGAVLTWQESPTSAKLARLTCDGR